MIRVSVTIGIGLPGMDAPHAETLHLEDSATAGTLLDHLCMRHEAMTAWRGRIDMDRRGRRLKPGARLRDGDRIAITPDRMPA